MIRILTTIFLFGSTLAVSATAQERLETLAIPGKIEVRSKDIAGDIALAILAIDQTLHGKESDSSITFGPAAKIAADKLRQSQKPSGYAGYGIKSLKILSAEPSRRAEKGRRLFGVLEYINGFGLRSSASFDVDFINTPEGVRIDSLSVMPVSPVDMRIVLRILPRVDAASLIDDESLGPEALIARTGALSRGLPDPARGEWALVAISPDRSLPGDRLQLYFGARKAQKTGLIGEARCVERSGFPICVTPFKPPVDTRFVNVFLRTDLRPDKSDGLRFLGSKKIRPD